MELINENEYLKPKKQLPTKVVNVEQFRIKATDNLPADVYVSKIGNTKKFSKGNISAWTGMAKSKKTFAITMLVSSMVGGLDLFGKFFSYKKNKVVWIDTEQSPNDVQKVVRRIKQLAGDESRLKMYGLRPLSPRERVEYIEVILKQKWCDVLVIDGARDLLMNINDAEESTVIVTKLMKWSFDYNIHISTVVHSSNAGMKVRGHIGTEIENKSETVIKVEKDQHESNYSEITEMYGRGKGFESFKFYVDEKGMPCVDENSISDISFDENDTPF